MEVINIVGAGPADSYQLISHLEITMAGFLLWKTIAPAHVIDIVRNMAGLIHQLIMFFTDTHILVPETFTILVDAESNRTANT